jgi:membrane-bound lytic murein transglycosylase D
MAARLDMKVSHFLKYNDISIDHIVREDVYYFTQKKKNKSAELNHTVAAGDDLWLISQHYGVSLRRLQKLNGISPASSLKPGDVVWLTARKPYEKAAQAANQPELEVQKATFKSDFFDWEVKPGAVNAVVDNPVTEEELVQVETVPANEPVMESNEGKNVNSPVTQPVLVVHEVKAADTLYSVARQYNVSIKEIMDWNGKADFTLSLGEKLKIFTR